MSKILMAMSGGVDSSAAAASLKQQGHELVGVTLRLWQGSQQRGCVSADHLKNPQQQVSGCCGPKDIADARMVCEKMDFPFYALSHEEAFKRKVLDYFVSEYEKGRTPNPCVVCNEKVKFEVLFNMLEGMEADYLATGHYARIEKDQDGVFRLFRAEVRQKDQSYFLYRLTQNMLTRVLFPLGDFSKQQSRDLAGSFHLVNAQKPESMDICFVSGQHYSAVVETLKPDAARPGEIQDRQGNVLGEHRGLIHYTLGQRKGHGIARSIPWYVVGMDSQNNVLILGNEEDLYSKRVWVENVNFPSGQVPETEFRAEVKIRSTHEGAWASIVPLSETVCELTFDKAQRAVTPGQSAVFYSQDECLGGGTIERYGNDTFK